VLVHPLAFWSVLGFHKYTRCLTNNTNSSNFKIFIVIICRDKGFTSTLYIRSPIVIDYFLISMNLLSSLFSINLKKSEPWFRYLEPDY
jgi:hypothetical protein